MAGLLTYLSIDAFPFLFFNSGFVTINNRFTAAGTVPDFLPYDMQVTGFPLSETFATNGNKGRKVFSNWTR